jgi:CheY-like chemotaxis protein
VPENRKKIVIYSKLIVQHGWIAVMVKKHNLEIFTIENGVEALERTKVESPEFVLLDVSMPKLNGIECGREIKQTSKLTHVVVLSSVHSLSLQDTAKRSGIDFFVVASVSNVKIPEFVEAALNRKQLPPDASEEIEREVLSKRGAQRFPFEGEVQYQIGDKWFSGIFANVSQDGLLFQSKTDVEAGTKLLLSWMDHGKKHIEVSAIAVRQIDSTHPQYPFLIGVQFLKISPAIDQKIAELSEDIDIFQETTAIELDMDLIQDLLDERETYFKDMFQGGKAPLFVELSITDIVEHERAAFQQQDKYSKCIQELVSSKILCQMIQATFEQIKSLKIPSKNYSTRLVTIMSELLEKIEYAEEDSDALVKASIQEGLTTQRHQINESNNRLYQAKISIMKLFAQRIKPEDVSDTHQAAFENIMQLNRQLTSYQQHLDEIAKQEEVERKKMAATRIVKPSEKSVTAAAPQKVKMTIELEQGKKNSYIPFLAALVVLMLLIPRVEEWMKVYFLREDITLVVAPQSVSRESKNALTITLAKEDWDKLDEDGQLLLLDQIEVYLTRKKLHQAKIIDGERLIAAVYSSAMEEYPAFLHRIFLSDAEPIKPEKSAPITPPHFEIKKPDDKAAVNLNNHPSKPAVKSESKKK